MRALVLATAEILSKTRPGGSPGSEACCWRSAQRSGGDAEPHNHEGAQQAVLRRRLRPPRSAEARGSSPCARWLTSRGVRKWRVLAQRIVAAAKAQKCEPTCRGGQSSSRCSEIALEVLRTRKRIAALDDRLEELLLASNQRAPIVRSLPGMGTVFFAAEFLAEVGEMSRFNSANDLAAAAGLAPVLRSSGSESATNV